MKEFCLFLWLTGKLNLLSSQTQQWLCNKLCAWRHNMPPPRPAVRTLRPTSSPQPTRLTPAAPSAPYTMNIHDRQAAARSRRCRRNWSRRGTLCSDLNSQPKRAGDLDLDLWPFDPESDVRVTCDVGYLCANFDLPRPLSSRLRPDVCDKRQTDRRQTYVRRQTKASLNVPAY